MIIQTLSVAITGNNIIRISRQPLLRVDKANGVFSHRLGLLLTSHGSLDNAHIGHRSRRWSGLRSGVGRRSWSNWLRSRIRRRSWRNWLRGGARRRWSICRQGLGSWRRWEISPRRGLGSQCDSFSLFHVGNLSIPSGKKTMATKNE